MIFIPIGTYLPYLWQNYFSNKFKLFDSLLKKGWWYTSSIIDNNIIYLMASSPGYNSIFWLLMTQQYKITFTLWSINFLCWTLFLLFSFRLLCLSARFLCLWTCWALDVLLLSSLFRICCTLYFCRCCCKCWLPWIRLSFHYGKHC